MRRDGLADGVGISKWDLDTPALCVDLDALESNIATMQARLKSFGLATRPHAKTHKCAAIAKLQLAAGAIGICTAKVERGRGADGRRHRPHLHDDGQPVAGARSGGRWRSARRSPEFIHAVDDEPATRATCRPRPRRPAITADVVIDVAVGTRSGIPAGDGALALAQLVDRLPNLRLRGLLSYDGGAQHITGFAARKAQALENIEANAEMCEAMKKTGLQHRDLQRRRHRHLQHPAPRARLHRRAGRQLPVHGHAVPGDRQRRRRPGLQGLPAVADRASARC